MVMLLIKLSWRNVWRHKRRSLITALSVVITLFFMVLLESLNQGVSDYIIENEISIYSSHLELKRTDYAERRGIQQAITNADTLIAVLETLPEMLNISRRLEMLVLVSDEANSRPAVMWGLEFEKEHLLSSYIDNSEGFENDNTIWMGKEMAAVMGVQAGDSLILIGQTYFGRVAALEVLVHQLFEVPVRDVGQHFIMAPIGMVEEFANIQGGATSVLVTLADKNNASATKGNIIRIIDADGLEISTWEDIMAGRLSTYQLRSAVLNVLKIILFVVMGFGILSTIILTNNERKHEFGVLMALGMKRSLLVMTIITEMFFIGLIGLLAAMAAVFPLITVIYNNPIPLKGELATIMSRFNVDPVIVMSNNPEIFIKNAAIGIVLLMSISLLASTMIVMHKISHAINT